MRTIAIHVAVVASLSAGPLLAGTANTLQKCQNTGDPCTLIDSAVVETDDDEVGIGVSSPAWKLDVDGQVRARSVFQHFRMYDPGTSTDRWKLGFLPGTDSFAIYDELNSHRFVVTQSGNVGIGTGLTEFKLDVKGTGRFAGNLRLDNQSDLIITSSGGTEYGRIYANDGNMVLRANSSRGADIVIDHQYSLVGIGGNLPNHGLDVSTSTTAYWGNRSTWFVTSDRRLKKNVTPLTGAIDRLSVLQPVEYEWQDSLVKAADYGPGRRVGFIAQDVESAFPSWVSESKAPEEAAKLFAGKKVKGFSFPNDYQALLVGAIKELHDENQTLQEQVWKLREIVCVDHPKAEICTE